MPSLSSHQGGVFDVGIVGIHTLLAIARPVISVDTCRWSFIILSFHTDIVCVLIKLATISILFVQHQDERHRSVPTFSGLSLQA